MKINFCPLIFYYLLMSIQTVRPDRCSQPLGMESGMIETSKIKIDPSNSVTNSVRLNNGASCRSSSNFKSVQIDLGRLMKITGLKFLSDKDTNVALRYGTTEDTNLENDYNILKVTDSNEQRKIAILRDVLKNEVFQPKDYVTLRFLKLTFSTAACVKFEIYGCPETTYMQQNSYLNKI